jgi:hypothetical protein
MNTKHQWLMEQLATLWKKLKVAQSVAFGIVRRSG